MPIKNALSYRVDTHIAARLPFQPASLAAAGLPSHAPASRFGSTTLHYDNSFPILTRHYRPKPLPYQRFCEPFLFARCILMRKLVIDDFEKDFL